MKRVLIDEPVVEKLRHHLWPHRTETVGYHGLKGTQNGELLRRAEEAGFDVLLTSDKNIPHQNNLSGRRIAGVVIFSNTLTDLLPSVAQVIDSIAAVGAGEVLGVEG